MQIRRPVCAHKDSRGEITDLLVKENVEYVTLITSRKGTTRGNHFHKATTQWVYVLEGRLKVLTQLPEAAVVSAVLEKGDLIVNTPMEGHAMVALEDSSFLVFTKGPRGGEDYESDTYRLPEPLQD
jgi:oxalate decarboxylase/phosphoglucose isomerase-like protein (cupin superfamily)